MPTPGRHGGQPARFRSRTLYPRQVAVTGRLELNCSPIALVASTVCDQRGRGCGRAAGEESDPAARGVTALTALGSKSATGRGRTILEQHLSAKEVERNLAALTGKRPAAALELSKNSVMPPEP